MKVAALTRLPERRKGTRRWASRSRSWTTCCPADFHHPLHVRLYDQTAKHLVEEALRRRKKGGAGSSLAPAVGLLSEEALAESAENPPMLPARLWTSFKEEPRPKNPLFSPCLMSVCTPHLARRQHEAQGKRVAPSSRRTNGTDYLLTGAVTTA